MIYSFPIAFCGILLFKKKRTTIKKATLPKLSEKKSEAPTFTRARQASPRKVAWGVGVLLGGVGIPGVSRFRVARKLVETRGVF